MKPIALPLSAHHLLKAEAHALLLDEEAPKQTLRLAIITRGAERHIFPALALDDWGRERKGPGLYRWLYEEGTSFPRAEIFGFDDQGDEIQHFLRDLELSFRFPCYLFSDEDSPIASGHRLRTIFLPGEDGPSEPMKTPPPPDTPFALRRAAVYWRQVDPTTLHLLDWRPLAPAT